ncbi:hypothetical protein J32TS6_14190 [Virgibacillus pantothenticus]|uniref:hypothetical protein n=2 Tax=Virgibacillus pantothenticus TaxID=1473 RepID=UPI001B04C8E8|nr:hypothetical protein [Virgibacillus pantothenticus]MBU8567090.1 hypothetical protein [Virgibacillus pantothenticus]MBU8600878.1 hypothetical protein [Virgibacillus pantothenticus]MBU8635242.1 hypothetical protein [Virgibacillus pantothenticus]MBU8642941.1 hypothetical protein [Virgibacillus pantothenticus]MBU8647038.1 hypothetical protein [Virgibacillus pantothenticus]
MISLYDKIIKQKMTLISSLPKNDCKLAEAAWENGADAIKVHINVSHRASGTMFHSFDEEKETLLQIVDESPVPVGIVLGADNHSVLKDYPKIMDHPFDFISLYIHHTPPRLLMNHKHTTMLACDYSYQISEMEYIKDLHPQLLEASIVSPELYGEPLNSRDLLQYRRLVKTAELPVIVPSQKKIQVGDITSLAAVGVKGIMVGAVVTGDTEETIKESMTLFRAEIDKLK